MASFIPRGSNVIDIGAGSGSLQKYLRGCRYTPADIDGPTVLDFNAGIYPDGWWDVAVLSGSLEYAERPAAVLRELTKLAPRLVLSYISQGTLAHRTQRGWRNHLSLAGLEQVLAAAGWQSRVLDTWKGHLILEALRPHPVP
jgi:hypothetical protein